MAATPADLNDSLLSDDSLGSVPFLILGNKIDIPHASSEEELRHCLGLTNYTTGKGKVRSPHTGSHTTPFAW